jgi:hypothetical protein
MKKKRVTAIMWPLLLFSTILSITTIGLYRGAGLSTQERIQFNSIVNNYTGDYNSVQSLWASLEPLESLVANQTAAVARIKNYDIPNILECIKSVDESMPILLTEAAAADAAISAVDLSPLATLQPLLNSLQSMISAIPTELGLITVHVAGTMQWANVANEAESVNGTYRLESLNLGSSVELYYVRIPETGYYLTVETPTTAIVLKEWNPPLFVPAGALPMAAVETLLDNERNKIAILPGTLKFSSRQYDLPNGRILFYANITQPGRVVALVSDLEMNLFAY